MSHKPRIGIGLLTFNRPECRDHFLKMLFKFPPHYDYTLVIEQNNPSISKGKNTILLALSRCDYIFLFEDDCFPIKQGWDLPFIHSGYGHLLFMDQRHSQINRNDQISTFRDCSGVFMFQTNDVLRNVGFFNEQYPVNGLEHVGYSHRANKHLGNEGFVMLNDTDKWLYSFDLHGKGQWKVHHHTVIAPEERIFAGNVNSEVLKREIEGDTFVELP